MSVETYTVTGTGGATYTLRVERPDVDTVPLAGDGVAAEGGADESARRRRLRDARREVIARVRRMYE